MPGGYLSLHDERRTCRLSDTVQLDPLDDWMVCFRCERSTTTPLMSPLLDIDRLTVLCYSRNFLFSRILRCLSPQNIFPEREVVQLSTRVVALAGGNIHCITQQQPLGFTGVQRVAEPPTP